MQACGPQHSKVSGVGVQVSGLSNEIFVFCRSKLLLAILWLREDRKRELAPTENRENHNSLLDQSCRLPGLASMK